MKVVFQYYSGGGGALANVMLLLRAYCHQFPHDEMHIVYREGSDLAGLDEIHNVKVWVQPAKWHQELGRLRVGLFGLRKICREVGADIAWSLNVGPYARVGVPHVLSVNNPHQVYPWPVTKYHPDSRFSVWSLRRFFRRTLQISDGAIVQTNLMGDYLRGIRGENFPICVIPKSVESEQDFTALPIPESLASRLIGEEWFTYLYVATYVPHKNHITLIKACERFMREGTKIRVVFTISAEDAICIGGELARELIDNGFIVCAGWCRKEHLRSLYRTADACAMPSVLESLSSAHLEAMAWEKAQVVSDLPYARDLCGDAAIYVEAENPDAWSDALIRLCEDVRLREELVGKGLCRMRELPRSWDECARDVRGFLASFVRKE